MNPIEQKIYDAIVSRIKNFNDESYIQNIEFVQKMRKAKIIRLMQACSYIKNFNISLSDTGLIDGTDFSDIEGNEDIVDNDLEGLIIKYDGLEKPAKLSQLKVMVKNCSNQNRKVLIWSNHLKTIDLIKNSLLKEGHFVKVIIGFTTEDERKNIKKEFNEKGSLLNVIVANPKACSESISLHKACHNAIYYDQNYNTAEFLQSLDRIHRVGGSEHTPVFYDFLQYENTIEQKIYKKIREKADRQMKVIESDNLIFSPDESDDWNDLYEEIIK
jgi:SNF2 family DNA or RNA helicase